MCAKSHNYIVEVIGAPVRYIGTDEDDAISALLTISPDEGEEGYVVAEHESDETGVMSLTGNPSYCPEESNRIESEAIKAADDAERAWEEAHDAFHGVGPYALANQEF